jgi:hypothetical protein
MPTVSPVDTAQRHVSHGQLGVERRPGHTCDIQAPQVPGLPRQRGNRACPGVMGAAPLRREDELLIRGEWPARMVQVRESWGSIFG